MTWEQKGGEFRLGDLAVEKGGVIRDAKIVWQTHGKLNAARGSGQYLPRGVPGPIATAATVDGPARQLRKLIHG